MRALLHSLAVNEDNGIEFVLEGAEAGLRGADEHAAFMVEARRGFYFTEHLDGESSGCHYGGGCGGRQVYTCFSWLFTWKRGLLDGFYCDRERDSSRMWKLSICGWLMRDRRLQDC